MTAAKVSAVDGRSEAISFASGATVIVLFQTYIALLFAKFIFSRQDIINILQEIGVVLFLGLSVYFFWSARKPKKAKQEIKMHSKASRFFLGMLLSALNLFPIPYYVFVSVTMSAYGYFFFNSFFIYSFVLGVVLGSFCVFYLYILYFKKQENKTKFRNDFTVFNIRQKRKCKRPNNQTCQQITKRCTCFIFSRKKCNRNRCKKQN